MPINTIYNKCIKKGLSLTEIVSKLHILIVNDKQMAPTKYKIIKALSDIEHKLLLTSNETLYTPLIISSYIINR